METLTCTPTRRATFRVATTRPTQFIDLTSRLEAMVAATGIRTGLLNVQSMHTTVAIVVNEHEPLLVDDFIRMIQAAAPINGFYRHNDMSVRTVNVTAAERQNGHAHCRALMLPTSACLNIGDGRLMLGRWQRVFVVELDGPQERDVALVLVGSGEC